MSDNLIDRWLEARYTGESPGSDRFKKRIGEYHASSIGKCPRQTFFKFTRETTDDWSPYFELGNTFEITYGSALCWEYGDISDALLTKLSNEEIIEQSRRVFQDVMVDIIVDSEKDVRITGESDWTVLKQDAEYMVDIHGRPQHVKLCEDGTRVLTWDDGHQTEYEEEDSPFFKVVETKTTKKISWRKKYGHKEEHEFQVGTYMMAMGCKGEIAYMTRNELDEMVFPMEVDEGRRKDIELRARMLDHKLKVDELPDATPPRENQCKWCDWSDECELEGGSRWE